jgi:uncharacterized protein
MENLLFVALIAGVVAVAAVVARRPGRSAVRRRYDYDVGFDTERHGDGGPSAGATFHQHDGGYGGGSDGGGFSGGSDGGGGGGGGGS